MAKLYVSIAGGSELEVSQKIEGLLFLSDYTAPVITNNYQSVTSQDGSQYQSTTYDKSTYTVNLAISFGDYADYKAKKGQIYRLLAQKKLYRLRTDSAPYKIVYGYPTSFDVKIAQDGQQYVIFSINYDNANGVAYSNFRSDQLNWSAVKAYSDQLNLPPTQPQYSFSNQGRISVYNASDLTVDPYYQRHDLKITIHFAGSNLTLKNITNGSSYTYQQSAAKTDVILIDGINTYLNGKLATANTAYDNLTLDNGYNTIDVSGSTDYDINFSFPFMYIG